MGDSGPDPGVDRWPVAADVLWHQLGRPCGDAPVARTPADDALSWWDDHLGEVFPREAEARLARRVLNVLALASLFPGGRQLSVREMARILSAPVAAWSGPADDRAVAAVLERMVESGSYVASRPSHGGDATEDRFFLRRDPDGAARFESRVQELATSILGRRDELARAASTLTDSPELPLARLVADRRSRRTVWWQGTPRDGWLAVGDPACASSEERDAWTRELATGETDFLVFLVPPTVGDEPPGPDEPGPAAPEIALLPVVVWTPRPIAAVRLLAAARARSIVARMLDEERDARTRDAANPLSEILDADRKLVTSEITRAYAEGRVEGPFGVTGLAEGAGVDPFDLWLERAVSALLEHRYPRHYMVSPGRTVLSRGRLWDLIELFFKPGRSGPGGHLPDAVRQLVEGYLDSLGMVSRVSRTWRLDVDLGRSEVAREMLAAAGDGPVGVEELYWRLRKGPLGLGRIWFDLLLAALLFSGHLAGLVRSRRLPLAQLSASSVGRLTQVVREPTLPPAVLEGVGALRFLFTRRTRPTAWPLLPRQLWDEIVALRSAGPLGLGGLAARVRQARADPHLAHLGLERTVEWLQCLARLLDRVDGWSSPREGLSGLHAALGDAGLIESLDEARKRLVFLAGAASTYVPIAAYLAQGELAIGVDPRHGALALHLAGLRDRVSRPDTCLDADAFAQFKKEFASFTEAYRRAYALEHEEYRSPGALEAHARLASSAELAFVEAMVRSRVVPPPATLAALREELDAAARGTCARLTELRLATHARCVCGHGLGEPRRARDAVELTRWRDQALDEVVSALGRSHVREELEAAARQAQDAGPSEDAGLLGDLVALGSGASDRAACLGRLSGSRVESLLARVVAGREAPVRDLGALAGRLAGRVWTVDQVLDAVREWLGPGLQPSSRVRVVRDRRAALPVEGGSPSTSSKAWVALLVHWAVRHGVPAEAAVRAAGLAIPAGSDQETLAARGAALQADGSAAVRELADAIGGSPSRAALLDLVRRDGSPEAVARALARETVFPGLARDLCGLALRALAAGARFPRLPVRSDATVEPDSGVSPSVLDYRDLAGHSAVLTRAIAALADHRAAWPASPEACEERFARLEPLPLAASRLEERAARLSLAREVEATGIFRSLGELLSSESGAFATAYRALVPTIWQDVASPLWPHRVLAPTLSEVRRRLAAPVTALVVVDALRSDLSRLVDAALIGPRGPGLIRVARHTVWALAPTVTAVNLRALLGGGPPAADEVTADPCPDEPGEFGAWSGVAEPDGVTVEVVSTIDDHLHGSTLGLARLAEAVVPAVVAGVATLAASLPRGALIALGADHGFVEVAGWRPHGTARRWRHGGLDPFEVLVPLVVYRKA